MKTKNLRQWAVALFVDDGNSLETIVERVAVGLDEREAASNALSAEAASRGVPYSRLFEQCAGSALVKPL